MNYQQLINKSVAILKDNKNKTPLLDCEVILSKVLNISRENLLLNLNETISEKNKQKFNYSLEKTKQANCLHCWSKRILEYKFCGK